MSSDTLPLTEEDILALASPQGFERGLDYFESGALFDARRVGNALHARCEGSGYAPYRLSAQLGTNGVLSTHCTCPYDWGGICKHRVALLLAWVHTPEVFDRVAPVDERLVDMSREDLIALIEEMLRREPDLERLLDLPLRPDEETKVDTDAVRRQIRSGLLAEYPEPAKIAFELAAVADMADRLGAVGNWTAMGDLYHLILSEIIPYYEQLYDEDGDISSELQRCAEGPGACLEAGNPPPETRRLWLQALLDAEFKDIEIGGVDLAYPAGDVLIAHATDAEWAPLEERIREKIAGLTGEHTGWQRDALVGLLTERLDRTGRGDEVSALIFELGSKEKQVFELVRQGRTSEAIAVAAGSFADLPGLVIRFADALVEAGEVGEAVKYVTGQLESCHGYSYRSWLADRAGERRDPETALDLRLSLFHQRSNLENYLRLRDAARALDRWEQMRQDLVENLEAVGRWDLLVEIALEEGEVQKALEYLPRDRWGSHELKVARAAESVEPQAACEIYNRRIERLIAARGRSNYREAAGFLKRVKALSEVPGAGIGWEPYLADLRRRHARLPAFKDELDRAGL